MNRLDIKFCLGLMMVFAIALSGCDLLRTPPAPTPIPDAAYTAAAQTIIAQLTQIAPPATSTPLPTLVPSPTNTLLPTDTHTATPTNTPAPTQTEIPALTSTPTNIPEILFEDDFSYDTGWYTDKGEDFSFEYAKGGYRISVDILNAPIWSIRERNYTDVRVEVDAAQISGAQDGYYGLVCRHTDSDNYYALVIGSDGAFGIAKSQNGEFVILRTGTAVPGVIKSGEAANRVRADCVGETISLYANDQKLVEIQDNDFESGYIGVIAGTRLSGGVVVLFDNYAIYEP